MSERSIFFQALDRDDPAERATYLDEACAGDAALRRRIEALLQSHAKVGDFLAMPAPQQLAAETDTAERRAGSASTAGRGERLEETWLDFLAPSRRPDSLGRLEHYEVLEVVGKGGMGVVLRAYDETLHRVVAIKALAPALAATGSARQRFVREAQATAAVTHEHVIAIHAVEDSGPVPYLVMRFIDGLTLQEKLDRTGPLPLKEILRIGLQIASGLAAAHAQGLVHRDVKPSNILLENGIERVKITDFGLARAVDDASLTQSGVIAGTPGYMSPEQANGEKVDHRSDLFSLGSVLYTLCAGHPPFRAESTMAVLKRVCEETPRPLREINADVPEWLAAIIAKLHAKSPAERYQSAAEVAHLLGRHLAHLQQPGIVPPTPLEDSPGVVALPGNSETPDDRRRSGTSGPSGKAAYSARRLAACAALIGACAALIAVGCVVLYGIFWRPHDARAPEGAEGTAWEVPAWKPPAVLAPEELAKLPSPLDALKRESMRLPESAPPELVAVLGGFPRFAIPEGPVTSWMGETNDGRLLAVPCGDNILLFDTHTGTLLRTLTGHTVGACRPAFSSDGKRLASGSVDGILRVWDVATGREEFTLTGHEQRVWSVAFDPEGKRLVSADAGGTIKAWNARGELLSTFTGHTKRVHLVFGPEGKRLATAGLDGTCKIWATGTWKEIHALPGNDKPFSSVAWSPDGKLLAAGGDDEVILWNAATYDVLHTLKSTAGSGLLAFTPDGRTLLTAPHSSLKGERQAFRRWDVKTGNLQTTCELPTRNGRNYGHLSRDGRTVYMGGGQPADARVRVYDAETGHERFPLGGHPGAVLSAAVSPDGRTLATGSADRTVRLWDLAAWRPGSPSPPFRTLKGHTSDVWSIAFSPDGRLLTSGGLDGLLYLWDPASGHKVNDLTGHSPAWSYATFSPDGRTVTAGGKDGPVSWDAATGQPKPPWPGHAGEVRPVAYSPDGRLLASGGKDGTIQVLDAVTGERRHVLRGGAGLTRLAFNPDGREVAAADEAPVPGLHLWDLQTEKRRTLVGPTGRILGLAFHPGGSRVATASRDFSVRLWEVTPPHPDPSPPGGEGKGERSKEERFIDFRGIGNPQCVAFSREGRYLAVGLDNGLSAILRVPASLPGSSNAPAAKLPAPADLAQRPAVADALKREDIPEELLKKADREKAPPELVAVFEEDRHAVGDGRKLLYAVAISPDGTTLAFGGAGSVVRRIDLATGAPRPDLTWKERAPGDHAYSLAFSPDGKVLACGAEKGSLILWDAATGAVLRSLTGPDVRVSQIAFSPDGALLATAGESRGAVVRVWKVSTGQLLFTALRPDTWRAWSVAFSPDGKTLAYGLESGEVRLWDVAAGRDRASLARHGGRVRWLGFHPDGRSLVVAGSFPDMGVYVYDVATRTLRHRLSGHASEVLCGAWRADGRLLITAGSTDGTVRFWDLGGDRPRLRTLPVVPPNVPWLHCIALSPEGRHLAVCNPNGTVYLLRLAKRIQVFNVQADGEK